MEKYRFNEEIKTAITNAAAKAGSFRQLAAEIYLPEMLLQLIADGQFNEISKNTLEALMPKIREYLPEDEKNNILEFIHDNPATRSLGHSTTASGVAFQAKTDSKEATHA